MNGDFDRRLVLKRLHNNYVLIAYKDKNKNYEAVAEFCFRTKMTAYEIYAHYLDNKDLTSYMNFVYSD